MNSHYFNGLDEYDLDNEESIRSKWKDTRDAKIGLDSQNFQPFRKDFLHNNKENYTMTEERIEAFYREKDIIIKTFENQKVPPPFLSWASACFPPPILDSIEQLQFKSPTLIQSVVFPIILAGYDVIGIAQTGSGKTIAYLLPGLIQITSQRDQELINIKKQNGPQMLILVPTRELAIQIDQEIQLFTQNYRLKTVCVYGGLNNRKTQYYNLGRCPNILVATPGRLLDFLKERATTLSDVSYLVIDEADRLLEMGFEDTIREIVQQIRQDRQTVFFSATWPKAVKNLAFDFCQQIPIYVQIGKSNLTINKNIEQEIICLFSKDKLQSLLDILDTLKISDKVLIFSDQRYRCEQLAINMADMGYYTIALHGDKTQPQRDEIMKAFRSGQTRLLCATDLASRGLDVTDITVVINYDFPKYFDDYIHRIGRTGRGEKRGKSFSFLAYDKDEPKMARELLKLAQVANLKYDEFALQNFAAGMIPQIRNDFQSNKFKQSHQNYNQRENNKFSKDFQEQENFDFQKFRNPQENRNFHNENKYTQFQSFQNQKENSSFRNTDYNFNLQNNEKYQDYDNMQSRNQWCEDRNKKEQNFETENDRQNYYQKGDKNQFNGKQESADRLIRQEQSYDISNQFGNDYQDRFYENDRFDKQNKQDRQFRQKGLDWSQRQDFQQRQIGQDREKNGQEDLVISNRQDRFKSQNIQGEFNRQDRFDRQDRSNKKYQNDHRDLRQYDDNRRVFQDKQEEPFRQFEKNRENKRANFINQDDDRFENIKEQEMSFKQSQQQTKQLFNNNNLFKQDNYKRNDKQDDYWYNQKQQLQQQRISGSQNNNKNYEEDYKNFRQEECKRQNNNQADIGQNKNRFYQMNEKIDQNKIFHDQQGRFEQGGDKKHLFNNNYNSHEYNYKTDKHIRSSIEQRQEDDRFQQSRNFDSRNNNYQNQGKYYQDQNEKKGYVNFRDRRRLNNDQFEQNNNQRYQNDYQYNDSNRFNKNQIELNNNDNYKFKSHRNTQSLERNEQVRFYNSKQITRNITSSDDYQKQRLEENKIQRNQNYNTQQNIINIKEYKQNNNQTQNTEECKKHSLSINENQQGMEEINEIQEYNFNYNPNKSSSNDGEIQDQYHFDGYEQIYQEQKEIDQKDVNNQNQTVAFKSILKTNVLIPVSDQIQEIKEEDPNVEDDLKNQKSHLNKGEENKGDGSDNEFDFTRFSKQLDQDNQIKFDTNKYQLFNNNTESTSEQKDSKKDL